MMVVRLLFCFCSFLFSMQLLAQEELSLAGAIQLGLKNNYDINISRAAVEVASNQNNLGEAGRWPSLQLGLGQNNNANDQIQTASPFQPQGIIISSNLSPSVSLNWMLFEGFKADISKKRYDGLQLESEGNASIIVSNTIQAIVFAYYLVSLEAERLEVLQKSLWLSRDRYNYVRLKKEYGAAITTDLLLEEGNYLTDSVNFINQELAFLQAIRTLNTLMAVEDLNKRYRMTDRIQVPVENYDLKGLEEKMLSNNADLRTKYISQSVVKYDAQLARSELYPKISLGGNVSGSWGRVDQSNALFFDQTLGELRSLPVENQILNTSNANYALGLTLTYNLFNGHRISTAIKNANLREDISNMEIDKMTIELRRDLYTNFDNFVFRKRIYDINKIKLETAELNLNISEDKFKLGAINSIDFRVVQLNYLNAAIQELNSRYSLLESDVALMRLTGTILEEYQ